SPLLLRDAHGKKFGRDLLTPGQLCAQISRVGLGTVLAQRADSVFFASEQRIHQRRTRGHIVSVGVTAEHLILEPATKGHRWVERYSGDCAHRSADATNGTSLFPAIR